MSEVRDIDAINVLALWKLQEAVSYNQVRTSKDRFHLPLHPATVTRNCSWPPRTGPNRQPIQVIE